MALADLIRTIEEDARRKAEEERRRGEEAARAALERAAAGRERRRAAALSARQAELESAARARLEGARQRLERERLLARERLIERVFAAAAKLAPDPAARGGEALRRHLDEALGLFGRDPAIVRCAPGSLGELRSLLRGRPHLEVEADPTIRAGVKVTSPDGSLEVDNTLDGRLDSLRPELTIALLERLRARE